VTYRVTIGKPDPKVKLNTPVKSQGAVAAVDFPADTRIQIQRQKAGGAWKNLATAEVSVSGLWSLLQKMTSTGTYRYHAVFRTDTDHLKDTSYSTMVVVKRRPTPPIGIGPVARTEGRRGTAFVGAVRLLMSRRRSPVPRPRRRRRGADLIS